VRTRRHPLAVPGRRLNLLNTPGFSAKRSDVYKGLLTLLVAAVLNKRVNCVRLLRSRGGIGSWSLGIVCVIEDSQVSLIAEWVGLI
jgi:hypothetical protein